MFHILILKNHKDFLAFKVNAFLKELGSPAVLWARGKRRGVKNAAQIKAAVNDWRSWLITSDASTESGPLPNSFFSDKTLESRQEKCEKVSVTFEWALMPWSGTHQESCVAFVAARAEFIDSFVACGENAARVAGVPVVDDMIVSSCGPIDELNHLPTMTFMDYDIEGRVAWRVAEADESYPLLICAFDSVSGSWWRRYAERFEELTRKGEYAVYRASDEKAYHAIWERADRDDSIAAYTLSGAADVSTVLALAGSHTSLLIELKLLAHHAGWVYTHCYGGGSDEYHALFRSSSEKCRRIASDVIARATVQNQHVRLVGHL